MADTQQNISDAFWTDTKKLKTGEDAIKNTIATDMNKKLESNQISVNLDKWERQVIEKRKW